MIDFIGIFLLLFIGFGWIFVIRNIFNLLINEEKELVKNE
jgi:hypothetical protein